MGWRPPTFHLPTRDLEDLMKQQFTKGGHVTTATSPAHAVRLRFDGWQEVVRTSDPQPSAEDTPEPAVVAKPAKAPGRKHSS